jgi:hypothetical protein
MTVTDHDETSPRPAEVPTAPARRGRTPRRARRAPAGPAARFDPGRVVDARHRNPTWIIAGVLLVILSALGGVLLFTSSDDRTDVLVAATDLEPGAVLTEADLRIERVSVDAGVRSIPASGADALVGQHSTGRIPAGTMLAPAMFVADVPLGPAEMVVGASLDPGEAPLAQLEVGAAVELFDVAVAAPGEAAGGAEVATSLGTGTVWAVEPVATGQLWLSVRVPRDVGMAVAVASASDRLRVALVGGDG